MLFQEKYLFQNHYLANDYPFFNIQENVIDWLEVEVKNGRPKEIWLWPLEDIIELSNDSNIPLFVLFDSEFTGNGDCTYCGGDMKTDGEFFFCKCGEVL